MNQQVVYQDISQIHPYENNPRNNEAAIEPVAQSIKRFGFRVPILIDGKGTIIAGHTRYEAAKRLGMDEVPCIRVDDLTDEQIRAYRIPRSVAFQPCCQLYAGKGVELCKDSPRSVYAVCDPQR